MLGAIIGDVAGSEYEARATKDKRAPLLGRDAYFTDDTVLTVAVADALLHRTPARWPILERKNAHASYAQHIRAYGRRFPHAGYGQQFQAWLASGATRGYGSYGNGAAMHASPIGQAAPSLEWALREARWSAEVTHSHPQGVRGAQAVAAAVFLARSGEGKASIRAQIARRFGYRLDTPLASIRPAYHFDSSAQGSVSQALIAFFESENYEDAIRNAISLGGDSDTQDCIAGAVAQAFYRSLPQPWVETVRLRLDSGFRQVIDAFSQRFPL